MNKLFTIYWKLPNGYTISTSNFWTESAARQEMRKNSEWKFDLAEDNSTHKIWIAR